MSECEGHMSNDAETWLPVTPRPCDRPRTEKPRRALCMETSCLERPMAAAFSSNVACRLQPVDKGRYQLGPRVSDPGSPGATSGGRETVPITGYSAGRRLVALAGSPGARSWRGLGQEAAQAGQEAAAGPGLCPVHRGRQAVLAPRGTAHPRRRKGGARRAAPETAEPARPLRLACPGRAWEREWWEPNVASLRTRQARRNTAMR
jgi:hypothetical protein